MQRPTLLLSLLVVLLALGASVEATSEKQLAYAGRTVRRESRALKKDKGPKSTKAPKVKSTKAPKVKSTKAPKVKSTKAPKAPKGSTPDSSANQVRSSIAIASAVAGAVW
eukprot:CAMPEP_0203661588 /NCGR_PEP_ID=MMETSP0088-20131115/59684_1 /ASSEMBLY_ACC=CAM_ASM_001087 /TAXON_ID=426623 /ORGANISM="Chaetoceros affinis, Strain CCMP159" /LENGTH=109 /DNA_ID=CAMNT_0050524267 /DNA_START=147 /DNA_END=473 /DNA_ORIENTATION=-